MHICPEDPVWKRLEEFDDRKLAKWFKEWLHDSHTKYDKEIIFKGAKYDSSKGVTNFESVAIGKQLEIKIGTFCTM